METNKINTGVNSFSTLKGQAKRTYNRVMTAIAEDNAPSMCHTFAALTDGAKAIALQAGKFSNLYIRGKYKGMAAEESAKELTERAAALVSRKLRKIDMVCAVAFLAEYLSRQRKEIEAPKPTTPDTMNANKTVALCPLDFDTTFDAYNYAMAHRLDKKPLAVAIPTDAHGTNFLMSLAANGVKLFGLWSDELDSTANGYVYTTEAGAREALQQVEADDMEAGVYEPDFYKVVDMTKYFAV